MTAPLYTQAALMLRAPWQWGRNDGRLWAFRFYAGLAALVVGVPTVALMFFLDRGWIAVLMGVVGAVGLVALWAVQFSALLRLDHPHAARFVVGHGRALRAAALGLWLALVGFVGVIGLVALYQPGAGPERLFLLVLMAAGATLLYVALALRWWWLWWALWLPFPLMGLPVVRAAVQPLWEFLRGHWQAQPLPITVLALLAMGMALAHLFGHADAAHARAYARRENFRKIAAASAAGQKPALAAYGRWGEFLGSPVQRMSDAWLAHVTRSASPQPTSMMARAQVVLMGAQHGLRHLAGMVVMQLVFLVFWALWMRSSGMEVNKESLGAARVGLSIGLASMAIAPLISVPGALWLSRREQALLMLLPGMPQGTALNAALARQQLKHFVLVWMAALPAFVALAWWGGSLEVWAFFFAAGPLSAMLWRDASRLSAPGPWAALPYLLYLVLGLLSTLLLRWQPALLMPWVLGMALFTAATLAWRWRQLLQWPQALPAGRLA